jgi:hypothetical protein
MVAWQDIRGRFPIFDWGIILFKLEVKKDYYFVMRRNGKGLTWCARVDMPRSVGGRILDPIEEEPG